MDKKELQEVRLWARKAFPLGEGSIGFETKSVSVRPKPAGKYELLVRAYNPRINKSGVLVASFTAKQWRSDPDNIVKQTWVNFIARVLAANLGIKL